jgi:hypothetical protein
MEGMKKKTGREMEEGSEEASSSSSSSTTTAGSACFPRSRSVDGDWVASD